MKFRMYLGFLSYTMPYAAYPQKFLFTRHNASNVRFSASKRRGVTKFKSYLIDQCIKLIWPVALCEPSVAV